VSLSRHRRAWEDLGRIDPLWAVLSSATRRHGRWDPAEFFATGEREIAALMKSAGELSLPRERGVALDFGCGVGRVARPLASHFESYIGVDISQPMIAQAVEWNRDCAACRFVLNTTGDLRAFESASIDLVYTKKVLQHLPTQGIVRSYLSELVRILRPGGLLVFQLPCRIGLLYRLQPQRRLYTVLRGLGISERLLLERLKLLPMQMRSMPEAEVVRLLTKLGARVVRIDHATDVNQVYFVSR
jgi:SAM-dependent methyltransferase